MSTVKLAWMTVVLLLVVGSGCAVRLKLADVDLDHGSPP